MSINESLNPDQLRDALAESVHQHWALYLMEGLLLLALGVVAIMVPPIATLSATIVVGWVFLAGGVFGLVSTFRARHAAGFWWSLISAVAGIAAGLVLLAWPFSGSASLTLVMIAFFTVEGIASIMFGFEHRRRVPTWGSFVASGVIDLLLAAIVFHGFPGTATWALGLLVGIDMIFGGAALTALALNQRRSDV
ncbi:HdeD family acid-resistance protein [Bradyrhizobium sp. RDM4]